VANTHVIAQQVIRASCSLTHRPCPTVIPLLKTVGRDKVLPDKLVPFLKHAIKLLEEHGDDLLVRPDEDDAQQHMDAVRGLLRNITPMADTAAVLQCPLSDEVQMSLALACAKERDHIVEGLGCNRVLTDARPHLEHLALLQDALRLPDLVEMYFDAMKKIRGQAEQRRTMALEALEAHLFPQVCKPLNRAFSDCPKRICTLLVQRVSPETGSELPVDLQLQLDIH
jgi:hypothetical protein